MSYIFEYTGKCHFWRLNWQLPMYEILLKKGGKLEKLIKHKFKFPAYFLTVGKLIDDYSIRFFSWDHKKSYKNVKLVLVIQKKSITPTVPLI